MTWLHADAHPHNGGYLIGPSMFLAVFVVSVIAGGHSFKIDAATSARASEPFFSALCQDAIFFEKQ
jgi:hypothetical protein